MAGYGLPDAATLAGLDTMARIRAHCSCREQVWHAVDQALGGVGSPTLFAMLPASTLRETVRAVRVGADPNRRELQAMEMIHVAHMWRVSRQSLQMTDPASTVTAPAAPVHPGASPSKKVKMSSVTDQMDDLEIDLMTRTELDQAHLWHIDMTGAEPSDDAEPTSEQVAALRDRIVRRGESPYADFSILTPFGRTMQKQLKTRSWLLQQDGAFKALDIPGPPSFEAWKACWKVFSSC